jgi:hypothetical protein
MATKLLNPGLCLLLVAEALCLVLPLQARADDATYCTELSDIYRRYLGQSSARSPLPDATASAAMNECQKGNTAAGIAILEKKLLDARFSLPARM